MSRVNWIQWGTYGLIFCLPWQTRYIFDVLENGGHASPFGVLSIYAVQVLLMITLLVFQLQLEDPHRRLIYVLVALTVWVALSGLWSFRPALALMQAGHMLMAIALFAVILDKRQQTDALIVACCLSLIIPSVIGIIQYTFDASPASTLFGMAARDAQILGDSVTISSDGTRELRAYGSFSHPNIFGAYLSVALILWFIMRDRLKTLMQHPWVHGAVTGLFVCALYMTASRSAWLGFMFAAIVFYAYGRTAVTRFIHRYQWAAIAAVTMILWSIAWRFESLWSSASFTERLDQYRFLTFLSWDAWLTGIGASQFPSVMEWVSPGLDWWIYQPLHNAALLFMLELGVVGGMFMGYFLWSTWKTVRVQPMMIAGIALLPAALVDHYLWTNWSGLALLAVIAGLSLRELKEI